MIIESEGDPKMMEINQKRRYQMRLIWIWWGFLMLSNVFSLTYSILVYVYENDKCVATKLSELGFDLVKFTDRVIEYQLWVIPLLYMYWPFSR